MSAPNTDPEKQGEKHKTPLVGMTMMIVWAAVLLVGLLVYLSFSGNEPGDDVPIDEEGASEQSDMGSGGADGEQSN